MARCHTNMPPDDRLTRSMVEDYLMQCLIAVEVVRDNGSPSLAAPAALLRWLATSGEAVSGNWELLAKEGLAR